MSEYGRYECQKSQQWQALDCTLATRLQVQVLVILFCIAYGGSDLPGFYVSIYASIRAHCMSMSRLLWVLLVVTRVCQILCAWLWLNIGLRAATIPVEEAERRPHNKHHCHYNLQA